MKEIKDLELANMCAQFLDDHSKWLKENHLTEEEYLKQNPSYATLLEYAMGNII